ncbi:hypothetical protein [Bosea sp. RAC05]|uniref:hypothetical protein n=1 Tax=Bosea sp. RAC05 TaxID=1842539 RepID=UPI00083D4441|nr:hypothetical protein [Bosea sp. RAC05]AOG03198.1 hypothetical protein BSY19_4691 [Bosea sp. RAC05]
MTKAASSLEKLSGLYLDATPIWLPEVEHSHNGELCWNFQMFANMPDAEMISLGLDIGSKARRIRSLEAFFVYGGASWLDDEVTLMNNRIWPCSLASSKGELPFEQVADLDPGAIEHKLAAAYADPALRDFNDAKSVPAGIGRTCMAISDRNLAVAFYSFDETVYHRTQFGIAEVSSPMQRWSGRSFPLWHVAKAYMIAGHLPPVALVRSVLAQSKTDIPADVARAMRRSLSLAHQRLLDDLEVVRAHFPTEA